MSDADDPERLRSETDKYISERNRGAPERVALGNNPYGSILRIVLAVVVFVALFGTIFFLAQG